MKYLFRKKIERGFFDKIKFFWRWRIANCALQYFDVKINMGWLCFKSPKKCRKRFGCSVKLFPKSGRAGYNTEYNDNVIVKMNTMWLYKRLKLLQCQFEFDLCLIRPSRFGCFLIKEGKKEKKDFLNCKDVLNVIVWARLLWRKIKVFW